MNNKFRKCTKLLLYGKKYKYVEIIHEEEAHRIKDTNGTYVISNEVFENEVEKVITMTNNH